MKKIAKWLKLSMLMNRAPQVRRAASSDPSSGSRFTKQPTNRPASLGWSDWGRRLQEFPGESHHGYTTRRCMRSGAKKWVDHACRNGLDPARQDWLAVDRMLTQGNLSAGTRPVYRSHIRSWFSWCRKKRGDWAEHPCSAGESG